MESYKRQLEIRKCFEKCGSRERIREKIIKTGKMYIGLWSYCYSFKSLFIVKKLFIVHFTPL